MNFIAQLCFTIALIALVIGAQALVESWIDDYYQCQTFRDHLTGAVIGTFGTFLPKKLAFARSFYECRCRQEQAIYLKQWLSISMWGPTLLAFKPWRYGARGPAAAMKRIDAI